MNKYAVLELVALYATVVICAYWSFLGGSGGVQAVTVQEDLWLSKPEKVALDKFKPRVLPFLPHSYMKHDLYLIRWLRAKNLNLNEAEEMLKSNLVWRREQKMDTIHLEDWADMQEDYPYTNYTFDKAGRPVGTANLGPQWDIRKIALAGKMPRMLRYLNKLLEELTVRITNEQKKGKMVSRFKVLFNLDGFNEVTHACPICLPAYISFVQTFEERYPGLADKVIFINTPTVFQLVINLVDPIVSPESRSAGVYLGTDKREWMKYLDNEISRSQRTVDFGGTIKD